MSDILIKIRTYKSLNQRLYVPNLIIIGIILKGSLKENSGSECLDKT